ncbi:hypothetical protein [Monaibacterium marinum]|uniref:hypothetical protein n=1 Tax=Pontivivens marinum TaxID=1690039 RepID=UPI001FEB5589|nr:hypothetical protein [Monaibacterium marinum]
MRIPPILRHIDAAAKREGVVGHNYFLVMTGTKGMMTVQRKMDLITAGHIDRCGGKHTAGRHNDRAVPLQDIDLQVGRPLDDRLQKGTYLVWQAIGCVTVIVALAWQHLDLKIEVPPDKKQLTLGLQDDLPQCCKVIFTIDDQRQALGLPHPPAVYVWVKETGRDCFALMPALSHALALHFVG